MPYYMKNTFQENKNYNYIFVKDELQIWYTLNCDYIVDRLKQEIAKFSQKPRIICLGQSAGGYAALLFGNLLNADKIIAISPQIKCFTDFSNKYRIKMFKKFEINQFKYINLNVFQNFKIKTIIIYGNRSIRDINQINFLNKNDDNLQIIEINTDIHNVCAFLGKEKFIDLIIDEINKK
jgi:hypothetical protein